MDRVSLSIVTILKLSLFTFFRIHGITQVASSSYDNCLQFDAVKEWSPAQNNGDVIIWLESGQTYYFIDSVGDNCNDGIKFKVSI